jgi:hypothetical protein
MDGDGAFCLEQVQDPANKPGAVGVASDTIALPVLLSSADMLRHSQAVCAVLPLLPPTATPTHLPLLEWNSLTSTLRCGNICREAYRTHVGAVVEAASIQEAAVALQVFVPGQEILHEY